MTFIDIHAHGHPWGRYRTRSERSGGDAQPWCLPDDLVRIYDEHDVEKGCLLPNAGGERADETQTNEEMLRFCATHPDRFIPFCNIDPRAVLNSASTPFADILRWYRDKGCKGVGEVSSHLSILDERVQALFAGCEEVGFPVTFHITPVFGEYYGIVDRPGLPGLEESLRRFPRLKFFGHSQGFWCEIGEYEGQDVRFGYPTGPVKEGRIPHLMRKYPNLYGDLSACSAANALSRDPAYGVRFMNEFQDRLMFGMDTCSPDDVTPLPGYLKQLRADGKLSDEVFWKIARRNAERLIGI